MFTYLVTSSTQVDFTPERKLSWEETGRKLGGNCHVATIQIAPGSSEVVALKKGKNREVQKSLPVSLLADICLLRLLISSSTKYSLCPELFIVDLYWTGLYKTGPSQFESLKGQKLVIFVVFFPLPLVSRQAALAEPTTFPFLFVFKSFETYL